MNAECVTRSGNVAVGISASHLSSLFVVKYVDGRRVKDTHGRDVMREAAILARLRHPNIIKLLDFYCVDDFEDAMVFPYAVCSLLDAIRRRHATTPIACFTTPELVHLSKSVLNALDYLNRKAVAHGDIKPANILWVPTFRAIELDDSKAARMDYRVFENRDRSYGPEDGTWVVSDFGTSYPVNTHLFYTEIDDDLGDIPPLYGTLPYLAPERLLGEVTLPTFFGDIWAFGCVVAEVIRGSLAFPIIDRELQVVIQSQKHSLSTRSQAHSPYATMSELDQGRFSWQEPGEFEQLYSIYTILGTPKQKEFSTGISFENQDPLDLEWWLHCPGLDKDFDIEMWVGLCYRCWEYEVNRRASPAELLLSL